MNKIVGKATASWLLIDMKTMSPTKLDVLVERLPKHNIEPAMTETLEKILEPESTTFIADRNFGYADID